jgi:tRNA dimethylallyltransferase
MLAGPTASGKSGAAVLLAASLPLEIVSADAMLVYRGMDIGTAKPSLLERSRVPHHLIDVVNPDEAFSVADYVRMAEAAIEDVLARGKLPLVVGGTGFYLRALAHGLPSVPPADPAAQAELWEVFERQGINPLASELERLSPHDAARAQRNPRRVVRALEIIRRTGRPPSSFPLIPPRFTYSKVTLLPSLERLRPRIEARAEAMFAAGLVDEVKRLIARYPKRPTAMQAIGYKEVVDCLEGRVSLAEAKAQVLLATAQYARRQRTWLRKEPGARRLEGTADEVFAELLDWLESLTP